MALTRFATVDRALGFDIVFLGIELNTQSIFDADAHVTADGSGRVSVTSSASFERRKSTKKEEREIRFVDAFELAAAEATRQFEIDLNISHEDEALERQEIARFLESFERARLLTAGTTERAVAVFERWAGPGDDPEVKADINLGLALDEKSSKELMQLTERNEGNLTDACRRRLFRIALRELGESGAYDFDTIGNLAEVVRAQTRMDDSKTLAHVLFDYTSQLHERALGDLLHGGSSHARRKRELERASRLHGLCMGLVEFVDTMGDIYEAKPGLGGDGTWNEDDYLDAQRKLNRLIRRWLRTDTGLLFWISDKAHPLTVAFTGALIAIASIGADQDSAPALVVNLVRRDGTPGNETLAG